MSTVLPPKQYFGYVLKLTNDNKIIKLKIRNIRFQIKYKLVNMIAYIYRAFLVIKNINNNNINILSFAPRLIRNINKILLYEYQTFNYELGFEFIEDFILLQNEYTFIISQLYEYIPITDEILSSYYMLNLFISSFKKQLYSWNDIPTEIDPFVADFLRNLPEIYGENKYIYFFKLTLFM